MARGTKKTVEALEQKFETQKKPVEQDFFDMLASFYHKDEDLAFLISLSKATVTDVEAGEDHTRFMTALRTYQAIKFWTRLGKLSNLYTDVNTLIMQRINEMWSQLLANDDTDNVIDTLGEVFAAFQNFQEYTGGLNAHFSHFYSVLRDMSGERVVRNTFDNHDGRIGNLEYRLVGVPNNERQVQNSFDALFSVLRDLNGDRIVKNSLDELFSILRDMSGDRTVRNTFDNHDGRIGNLEYRLVGVPNNERQVQNSFDDLFSRLRDLTGDRVVANVLDNHEGRLGFAENLLDGLSGNRVIKNTLDDLLGRLQDLTGTRSVANILDNHNGRINTAQGTADTARNEAANALARAEDAHNIIGRPGGTGEKVWDRITGVYSYATVVAGVVNQIEFMLGGLSFGASNAVKNYVDGSVDRLNGYSGAGSVKADTDGIRAILNGFTGSGSVMGEIQDIRNKLRDAGIAGF